MPVLLDFWIFVAAVVFVISVMAHGSTYLGVDLMQKIPGVMFIHVTIFPPFIAAIVYGKRLKSVAKNEVDAALACAPRWLAGLAMVCFAYALVNFAIFLILTEGGGPMERDGHYYLTTHGTVLRTLTEDEFHRQQAYVVRGFSGHWMLFSSFALATMVGVRRFLSGRAKVTPLAAAAVEPSEPPAAAPRRNVCIASLVCYGLCVGAIFSGWPALYLVALAIVLVSTGLAWRWRRGLLGKGSSESMVGCVGIIPSFFIAWLLASHIVTFVYIATHIGLTEALNGTVTIEMPRDGPVHLSNGQLMDGLFSGALFVLIEFPLVIIGGCGLVYLLENVGCYFEARKRAGR